jgi:hypothetical protein
VGLQLLPRSIEPSCALLGCALLGCAPRVPFGDDRVAVGGTSGMAGATAVGGAGGSSNPTLDELAPGSAVNLGRYECTDLPGGSYPCQTINDYSRFVYDRGGRQLLWFGGGIHGSSRTDVAVFSLDTLRWESAYEPTPCSEQIPENADLERGAWTSTGHPMSRETFDMLVMAENTGELVMLTYNPPSQDCQAWPATSPTLEQVPGRVAHYAPAARSWRFSAALANTWPMDAAAEYDPESGLVLVLGPHDLWTYDPATELVEHRFQFEIGPRIGYSAELVYFPPSGRFYYFTRTGFLFELTVDRGAWENSSIVEITDASGDLPAAEAKGWAYDAARQTIGGGVRDSVFWELEPATRAWTAFPLGGATGEGPGSLAFFTLDYATQAGVFLFFTDYTSGWATWAFRP